MCITADFNAEDLLDGNGEVRELRNLGDLDIVTLLQDNELLLYIPVLELVIRMR